MSVQSEIDRIITAVGNAYSKVSEKGGTVPASQTVSNLATAIESIPSGGTLITKTITQNGTYNASADNADGYSQVTVNVASGGGGAEPATLTITSQNYTGNRYATFIFVDQEGHLKLLNYTFSPFTFPITIETRLGGFVSLLPSGFPGNPDFQNLIGCEFIKYTGVYYILVTEPQASAEIYDFD